MLKAIISIVTHPSRTSGKLASSLALSVGVGALILAANPVSAHPRGEVSVDVVVRGGPDCRRWVPPVCEERPVTTWVEPIYRTVCDEVFVKPEYRTIIDRRWVEPVYRTVCERVWVPEVYEIRDVTHHDACGRPYCTRERVLVCAGHYETREHRLCVCDGHSENVEHVECVSEGHYRHVERQELVTPGHYETRTQRVEVAPGHWETYASSGWELRVRE